MRFYLIIIIFISSFLYASNVGQSMAGVFSYNPSSVSSSMGDTQTLPTSAFSSFYNPASLCGFNTRFEAESSYRYILNMFHYTALGFRVPLSEKVCFGVNAAWLSYGNITIYENSQAVSVIMPYDFLMQGAAAFRVNDFIQMGISPGFLYQKLSDEFRAKGFLLNTGILVSFEAHLKKKLRPLRVSLTFKNMGVAGLFYEEYNPLPAVITIGTYYSKEIILTDRKLRFSLALDISPFLAENGFYIDDTTYIPLDISSGAEVSFINIAPGISVFIRGGYSLPSNPKEAISGFRAGAGVEVFGLTLSYAFSHMGEVGFSHQISLGYKVYNTKDKK